MATASQPIDASTMSRILQLMNSTPDANAACLDVVPCKTATPFLHVAYWNAVNILIPAIHWHYSYGAINEDGDQIPFSSLAVDTAVKVADGELTGAINLFLLTSLRTIAVWSHQYPEEAEDAEVDARKRLATCDSEQLFLSRTRDQNVQAATHVIANRTNYPIAIPAHNLPFAIAHFLELVVHQALLNFGAIHQPSDEQAFLYIPENHFRDVASYIYFCILLEAI